MSKSSSATPGSNVLASSLAQDPCAPISKIDATEQAERNLKLLNLDGSINEPRYEFMTVLEQDLMPRAKLNKLKKVADKLNAVATPRSACRSGCSHCCHISVVINKAEADAISSLVGAKQSKLGGSIPSVSIREKWFGVPCPFLKKGRCSVYEARPISCRLMFNLADSPYFCDTRIKPEDSHVTMLNLKDLENGYVKAFLGQQWGDIRDFFPIKI
jgi:hypothetical protein